MSKKKQTIEEKLERVIFDWVPRNTLEDSKIIMRRQPDKAKISFVMDLIKQVQKEEYDKGYQDGVSEGIQDGYNKFKVLSKKLLRKM